MAETEVEFDERSAQYKIAFTEQYDFGVSSLRFVIFQVDRWGNRRYVDLVPGKVVAEFEAMPQDTLDSLSLMKKDKAEELFTNLVQCGVAPDQSSLMARLEFAEDVARRMAGKLGES